MVITEYGEDPDPTDEPPQNVGKKQLFELGEITTSQAFERVVADYNKRQTYFDRHQSGEYGNITTEMRQANRAVLTLNPKIGNGYSVTSAYKLPINRGVIQGKVQIETSRDHDGTLRTHVTVLSPPPLPKKSRM